MAHYYYLYTLKEIAFHKGVDNSYVSRMVNLTTLAPDIVAAILDDNLPNDITLFDLAMDPASVVGGVAGNDQICFIYMNICGLPLIVTD